MLDFALIHTVRMLLLQGTEYSRNGTVFRRGVFNENIYIGAADSAVRVHRYSHLLSAKQGGSLRITTRLASWNRAAAACGSDVTRDSVLLRVLPPIIFIRCVTRTHSHTHRWNMVNGKTGGLG